MTTARTEDGIEVEWTSTALGTEALDAALQDLLPCAEYARQLLGEEQTGVLDAEI